MNTSNRTITTDTIKGMPRIIWMYWHQGLEDAPQLVQHAVSSWKRQNPDWQLILLDKDSVETYIQPKLAPDVRARLSLAHQTDVLRLQLLAEYGGVWADATTLCLKPLDNWLPSNISSGFFAFHQPGPDRLISNWFLASEKQGVLVTRLLETLADFYTRYAFDKPGFFRRKLVRLLSKVLNRSDKTTSYWFSPIFTKVLRIYPYFIFHYLFAYLVQTDSQCRAIWHNTPKVSSIPPHKIRRYGMIAPLTDQIKAEIDNDDCPVYKLNWRYEISPDHPHTIVAYLLEKHPLQD